MKHTLYNEQIKLLAKSCLELLEIDNPNHGHELDNPLCGDRVSITLSVQNNVILDIGHHVRGCMLCCAATSALRNIAIGTSTEILRKQVQALESILKGQTTITTALSPEVMIFETVASHINRHNCVLLPFSAAIEALSQD